MKENPVNTTVSKFLILWFKPKPY